MTPTNWYTNVPITFVLTHVKIKPGLINPCMVSYFQRALTFHQGADFALMNPCRSVVSLLLSWSLVVVLEVFAGQCLMKAVLGSKSSWKSNLAMAHHPDEMITDDKEVQMPSIIQLCPEDNVPKPCGQKKMCHARLHPILFRLVNTLECMWVWMTSFWWSRVLFIKHVICKIGSLLTITNHMCYSQVS